MKRCLTENEIQSILDRIDTTHTMRPEIHEYIVENTRAKFRGYLENTCIYPEMISELSDKMIMEYYRSMIQPGDCVGVLTAQSIGENQTQSTLNSFDYETELLIQSKKGCRVVKMGEYIDNYLKMYSFNIQHIPENRTEYLEINDDVSIPSTDENGKMDWYKIEAVTRHLPVGQLIKVTTQSGREVVATQQKSFLRWNGSIFEATDGNMLNIGDILPTINHRGYKKLEVPLDDRPTEDNNNLDVYFDRVVDIKYIDGTTQYVYDLTVEKTRNFSLFNGLNVRDSFHHSGITSDTVITGVPRFAELLNATKNPKSVQTYIQFNYGNETIQDTRHTVGYSLVELTLERLVTKTHIHFKTKKRKPWYDAFELLYGEKYYDDVCITYYINVEKLYKYRLPLSVISNAIEEKFEDLACIYSPTHIGQLDVFIDTSEIQLPDYSAFNLLDETNKISIYIKDVVVPNLASLYIVGIPHIDSMFYQKHPKGDWYVEAQGSNLLEILKLDYVNKITTCSNNMWEVYAIFGIEATRAFLMEEFDSILSSDTYINARHITLLVDIMLFTGTISSISRYGVHRNQSGPISRSSFEESLDNFVKAGLYGENESTSGVSAAIICGKPSNIGTGLCELIYNPK